MDTQETGTEEETETVDSTDTDETVTDDTSEAGTEDADQELKRIKDKKQYIKDLDRDIKELEQKRLTLKPKSKSETVTEDQDDVMTWATINSDSLKIVGKEYKEELAFYKAHKIHITSDIRDRALRDARARKGLGSKSNAEANRQAETSTEVTTEMRKSSVKTGEIPASIKAMRPDMTLEQYESYKADIEAKKQKKKG